MHRNAFKNLLEIIVISLFINSLAAANAVERNYAQLKSLLPTRGYEELAQQDKHVLGGIKQAKSEILLLPFNLGPTGIQAVRYLEKMAYEVSAVATGSPAEGFIKVGDVIYGANGKEFGEYKIDEASARRAPNPQMGQAIEDSEAQLKGKLTLMLRRDDKELKIAIMLKNLGSFGKDFPKVSAKADYLAELNARILVAKQLPNGLWEAGITRARNHVTCLSALALMAMDDRRYRKALEKAFDSLFQSKHKHFESWFVGYQALFLGEYYLRYKDK
ncbi:MAG: hypothetical protein HRT88_04000, partial [Lentisphaeraceae bacterium]|nr:hypothetical protein [Lentisphaeraceae bacterium]